MNITIDESRLMPGTRLESGALRIPARGGGVYVNELSETTERYLNFKATVLEDHSMGFELRVFAEGEDERRVDVRFGAMPHYRTNICIDLNLLDGHILFPGNIAGEMKVVCHGSRIDRKDIVRAELASLPMYHEIGLLLEDVQLSDEPLGPAPLPDEKLIDEMGQFIPKTWPEKQPSVGAMVESLRAEAAKPEAYPFANWTKWGGMADMKLTEGTGFFSHVKKDGRWYLADPEGCAFYSMGPDCVVTRADARIDGQESLLTWVPDDPDVVSVMDHRWGEADRDYPKLVAFGRANLKRAFGEGWEEAWRGMVIGQLKRMGMNTLANWSDESLFGRMPYVTSLPEFPRTGKTIFRDFPDVLSPEYAESACRSAQSLLARKDDPYMIGYFLRNEPNWAFVDNLIIADEVLRNPENTWCRRGLIGWLKDRYGDIAAMNEAWGSCFSGFEALESPIGKASDISAAAEADLRAYSAELVRTYVSVPAAACRAVDPNHMILGMRWAWISDAALAAGWESFDVFSINCYAVDPTSAIERVRELGVDLPVMIGEFHFGALDGGLTATGLEGVTTQKERGKAYRYYMEQGAAHPMCVGAHWFQCYDQFALGRFDGENYNIGLFDVCFQPYREMARSILACSSVVYGVHAGQIQPVDEKPESIPMIAY